MTVSTEYFDYVFDTTNKLTKDINKAIKKLGKLQEKQDNAQALVDEDPTSKRLRRLDKKIAKTAAKQDEIDELIGRIITYESVELPQDEITYSLWNATDDLMGIQVTITDSPYDDTFVGGQASSLMVTGTGARSSNGGTQSFGTRVSLIGDDFADGTETFGIAGTGWTSKVDGTYPDVTASLLQGFTPSKGGDYEQSCVTAIYSDGVLQV